MSPFLSIIIPLYNSAGTLDVALKSIADQHFKDLELVLIDGGSTDGTSQQIAKFRGLHPDITVKMISEPDKGIYDAMNKGIDMAGGEWLYFMGSDDSLYSPLILNEIADALQNEDIDLLYGNVTGMSSKTRYVYDTFSKVFSTGIHHQSVFYKNTLFKDLGKYNLQYKIAADYDFTLKVFQDKKYKIKYIDKDIACYGEGGYSAQHFDYLFFSGHYKILAQHGGLEDVADKQKCLNDSIYCCFYLAKEKSNLGSAWTNLLYYITHAEGMSFALRIKNLFRMLMWTVKPR